MFDLNLTVDSNADDNLDANNCDGWSGETSAANGEGESSSSYDDTCSIRASSGSGGFAFNFDASNNSDQGLTSSESGLVTRDLFPVSRPDELDRGWRRDEAAAPTADHGRLHYNLPRAAVQQEVQQVQAVQARKSRRGPRSRSSQYRGVTFYRRTGRWESHIWDCGKQVYLGGFDTALAAARAYDRAAIKFRGVEADINFNLSDYDDMKQMMNLSKEEFVQTLRRQSSGFARGSSKYRVAINKCGRWDTRTGEPLGMKAYDKAAIICNRSDAVASFEANTYNGETMLEPRYGGSQHDLNLNLGMSAASSPKESGWLDSSRTLKLHAGSSASNVTCDPPLEGVPVGSQHPSLCSGVNTKFVPNNEERERSASISQLEMAKNLGWRVHGNDRTAWSSTLATAASSGFSSQETAPNTFACYSWIKPYLPPS